MSKFYEAVFEEFRKELEKWAVEIFLHPLPFTQVNRLAILAATVAERCRVEEDVPEPDCHPECTIKMDGACEMDICVHYPPIWDKNLCGHGGTSVRD